MKIVASLLRLVATVVAFVGLDHAVDQQSDWRWALIVLNVATLIAIATVRRRSPWFMDRLRDEETNFRLAVFITLALVADLVCLFIKWPE